jgi:Sulfotransferase domain
MSLLVVGAGVGRTATHSLKIALERLLGGRCYHMVEVFAHPEHVPLWHAAMRNEPVDWSDLFDGYQATVDWPGAAVWREISVAYPDALVLLSTRRTSDEWYASASRTIFLMHDSPRRPGMQEWRVMVQTMFERLSPDWHDAEATKAGYERHNAEVRAEVPANRLVNWQAADGWGPLCSRLGLPEPGDPFPLTNTTAEFRKMTGLDPS